MSQIEQIDIDALPAGRELDALVMTEVMGYTQTDSGDVWRFSSRVKESEHGSTFHRQSGTIPYSTDANRVREVEEEIERRGLTREYCKELVSSILDHPHIFGGGKHTFDWFPIITATPAQRCRAAYRAVMG